MRWHGFPRDCIATSWLLKIQQGIVAHAHARPLAASIGTAVAFVGPWRLVIYRTEILMAACDCLCLVDALLQSLQVFQV